MKKIKSIIKIVKKYLPDAIILAGIYITSYYFLLPKTSGMRLPNSPNYYTEEKIFGIMIIAIGINIAIRKYITYKKTA